MNTIICPDTGIELIPIWTGELDAREACPRLSSFEYRGGFSPLAEAAAQQAFEDQDRADQDVSRRGLRW